jgi:antitoxin HicB
MTYNCEITQKGEQYLVVFPDMTNIRTCGWSLDEALYMAKDALDAVLETELSLGNPIPAPSYNEGYPIPVANHIVVAMRLREWRGNESQTAIAERLGIKYQSYQRLENPIKANPTIKTLEKIARIYGKSVETLIG